MRSRRWAAVRLAVGASASAVSGCGPPDGVTVFAPRCVPLRAGDSAYASAESHRGDRGFTTVALSDVQPERFRWASRDARVADVSSSGLVHARGPGSTWLVVTTDGVTDSVRVAVAPPSRVAVRLRPAPPYVVALGDTSRLRVDVRPVERLRSFDEQVAGRPEVGARRSAAIVTVEEERPDTGGLWVLPTGWRVIGRALGRDELLWSAAGRCGVAAVTVLGPGRP